MARRAEVKHAPLGRWNLVSLALGACVITTAVAIIETSHRCRQMYAQLQSLETSKWEMQEQWGRLLLEQSTWAGHHRVERLARKQLGMRVPAVAELQVVRP